MTDLRHRGLARVVAPSAEPLTLAETKEYLRVPHDDDDARISDMIITARALAEQWLKRSLVTQRWKLSFDDYASGTIRLPMGPVQSIVSVVTTDSEGNAMTLDASAYALNAARDAIVFESIITGEVIDITYIAGFGSANQVPKPIKLGMLHHIASMMDGGASLAPIPDGVLQFYVAFREIGL